MKTILYFLIFSALVIRSYAGGANITFDDPNGAGEASGFALEGKPEGGEWDLITTFTGNRLKVSNLTPGKWSLRIYATAADGSNSDYSNEVTIAILKAPLNLRVEPVKKVAVQRSEDLEHWDDLAWVDIPDSDRQFLRLAFPTD